MSSTISSSGCASDSAANTVRQRDEEAMTLLFGLAAWVSHEARQLGRRRADISRRRREQLEQRRVRNTRVRFEAARFEYLESVLERLRAGGRDQA